MIIASRAVEAETKYERNFAQRAIFLDFGVFNESENLRLMT